MSGKPQTHRNRVFDTVLVPLLAGLACGGFSLLTEPLLRSGVPAPGLALVLALLGAHALLATAWFVPGLIGHVADRREVKFGRFIGPALVGAGFGVFAYFVGADATSGAWAQTQAWAPFAPPVFALGSAVFAGAMAFATRYFERLLFAAGCFVLSGALLAADVVAFPETYDFLHLGLRVAGVGFAVAGLSNVVRRVSFQPPRAVAPVSALLLVGLTATWLGQTESMSKALTLRQGPAETLVELLAPSRISNIEGEALVAADSIDRSNPLPPAPRGDAVVDNVVVFYIDTLRFDAIPPNRPANGTRFATAEDTPFLNDFLDTCHTFERAYSPSSATHKSIPSTFRSRNSWKIDGYPLGLVLDERGITPAASVLNYFDYTEHTAATELLDGFENVHVYDSTLQSDVLPSATKLFSELRDERFFAWVHFFAVHRPGWDDRLLPKTMPEGERYRRSLKWLDGTLAKLVTDLKLKGLRESTAIVFASDHGEGLGDHNVPTHGPTVFDSEIRVPLAICLPDGKGAVHDTTVGNIDLIPTLLDLMGEEPDPTHLGHSFAAAMVDGADWPKRSYYFENWSGDRRGLWFDGKKLVYTPRLALHFLYDHASDPLEKSDAFSAAEHEDYVRLLWEHNPTLVQGFEANDDSRLALVRRLRNVDPAAPPPDIDFLLHLSAKVGGTAIETEVQKLFEQTPNRFLRARILDAFRSTRLAGKLLHEAHERGEANPWIIRAAARHRVSLAAFPKIEPFIMEMEADVSAEERSAWMELATNVRKDGDAWRKWLLAELERVAKDRKAFSDTRRRTLVWNVATTNWRDSAGAGELLRRFYFSDPDVNVQVAALEVVGRIGYEPAVPDLLRIAADARRDHMARREALRALGELASLDDGPAIVKAAENDMFLAKHAAFALSKLGDQKSVKKLMRRHPRIADDARKAFREAQKEKD